MDWLALILLGLVANLDNLGVCISYGMRGLRTGWQANTVIAGITLAVTALSLSLGQAAARLLPVAAAKHAGAVILCLIGIWVGLEAWKEGRPKPEQPAETEPRRLVRIPLGPPGLWLEILREPEQADVDRSGSIEAREAVLLGVALSLDAVGIGLGAGLKQMPVLATSLAAAGGSYLAILVGTAIGRAFGTRFRGRGASYAAAILLILISLWQWS